MDITALVASYGPAAVALGTGLEGDTAALAGGVLAGHGMMPWWQVALAAATGAWLSDNITFALGRRLRDARWVRNIRARPRAARAQAMIERRPALFLVGFRFVAGMRTVGPFAVAATDITTRRYTLLTLVSAAIWGVVLTGAGKLFGHGIELVLGDIIQAEKRLIIPAGLVLAPLVLFLWRRARHRRNGADRA